MILERDKDEEMLNLDNPTDNLIYFLKRELKNKGLSKENKERIEHKLKILRDSKKIKPYVE